MYKKILIFVIGAILGTAAFAYAAPAAQNFQNIQPFSNNTYFNGTSALKWKNFYATNASTTNLTISGTVWFGSESFTNFTTYVRSLFSAGTGLSYSAGAFSLQTPVSVANGGTNNTGFTDGGMFYYDGATSKIAQSASLSPFYDVTDDRVSIGGDNTPKYTLSINGSNSITGNGTGYISVKRRNISTNASIFTISADENAGIGTSTPAGRLSINLNTPTTASSTFAIIVGSSTPSATTTIFSVDNTGAASTTKLFGAQLSICQGSNQFLTWSGGTFGCGTAPGGNSAPYPFTPSTSFGGSSATGTMIADSAGFSASSTSYFTGIYNYGFAVSTSTTVCKVGCQYTDIQTAINDGWNVIYLKAETYALSSTLKIPNRNNFILKGEGPRTLLQFNRSSVKNGMYLLDQSTAVTGDVFQDFALQATGAATGGTCIDFSHMEITKFIHVDCLTAQNAYVASSSVSSFYDIIDSPQITIDGGYGGVNTSVGINLDSSAAIETTIINPRIRPLSTMSSSTGIRIDSHDVTCIRCDVESNALYGLYVDDEGSSFSGNMYLEGNQTNVHIEPSLAGVGGGTVITGNIADGTTANLDIDPSAIGVSINARVQYAPLNTTYNQTLLVGTTSAPSAIDFSTTLLLNHQADNFLEMDTGEANTSGIEFGHRTNSATANVVKQAILVQGNNSWKTGDMLFVNNGIKNSNANYSTSTDVRLDITAGGDIGVASTTPMGLLSLMANTSRFTATSPASSTILFAIGSSTPSATTTLFTIDNTGKVFAAGPFSSPSTIASSLTYASTTAITASTLYATTISGFGSATTTVTGFLNLPSSPGTGCIAYGGLCNTPRWLAPYHGGFDVAATSQETSQGVPLQLNRFYYSEFETDVPVIVDRLCYQVGSVAAGNAMLALYGPVVTEESIVNAPFVASTTATAQGSTSQAQCIAPGSGTVTLGVGRYYIGIVFDNASSTFEREGNAQTIAAGTTGFFQVPLGQLPTTVATTAGTATGNAIPAFKIRTVKPN